MEDATFRPELSKGEWKRQSRFRKRQFGRYDFEQFSNLSMETASVGHGSIGKVQVDCCFLFKESKWGVLNMNGQTVPAGIVRLDLSFGQIQGYKLMWATIKVTLDGEHKDLQSYRDNPIADPRGLVYLTTDWGPDHVVGAPMTVSQKKTTHATPSVSFPQGGVGGVGQDREESFERDVRWTFTGNLRSGKGKGVGSVVYNSLEWHLWENDLETQSSHGNKFRTAFAFVNSGQPFLMKVEIDGGLHRIHHQLLDKFKFRSRRDKEESISTTLVRGFNGRMQPLDELASHLNEEMKDKNRGIGYSAQAAAQTATSSPPAAIPETGRAPPADPRPAYREERVRELGISHEQVGDVARFLISSAGTRDHHDVQGEANGGDSPNETGDNLEETKITLQRGTTLLQVLLYFMQDWLQYISQLLDRA